MHRQEAEPGRPQQQEVCAVGAAVVRLELARAGMESYTYTQDTNIIIPPSFWLGLTSRDEHTAVSAPPTLGLPRRRCGSENRIGAAVVRLELARAGRQEVGAACRARSSRPGNLSRAREAAGGLGQQEPSDIICM